MVDLVNMITALNWRWEAGALLSDLSFFWGMDCNEIVALYIKCGAGQDIEKNLNKLHNLNLNTARLLIQRGASATMTHNMWSFIESDHDEIKTLLAKYGYIVK